LVVEVLASEASADAAFPPQPLTPTTTAKARIRSQKDGESGKWASRLCPYMPEG
jgi:hypothetical protein